MTNDLDLIRFKGWARTVELTAARYGQPLGTEYDRMVQVAREANQIVRETSGRLPVALPTDPSKVAAHIKRAAAQEAGRGQTHAIATEIAERAETQATRTAIDEAPRLAALIKDRFDEAVAELLEIAHTAPTQLSAHSTADDFAAHTRLLALVDTLNLGLASRSALAPVFGEDLRGSGVLWLVLDPAKSTSCAAVQQALADYAEQLPETVDDWLRVTTLGASLAQPEQAADRAAQFGQALYSAGLASPDGGLTDRTYGEALNYVGSPANRAMAPRRAL
ncbi:hypothetical protein [Nocardioides cynanchi]|uniref:hypothetical protein n=1 Tax=Nocardioides cynanchi TaxID=2558918 RepID=UPI001246546E|nr:hypothetical protein [Nocardioides cynanchi]